MSSSNEKPATGKCPLPVSAQNRNLFVFAICNGLQYLAAPVMYVGITQASLLNRLGTDARVANLPATFYFAMTAMPALMAWMFPHVRHLKRTLSVCFASIAAILAVVAIVLKTDAPDSVKVAVVILQGAVSGAFGPTAVGLLWEVLGRGTDESRRGFALSMAFGVGPLLAVIGSVGQAYILDRFGYPDGFIWLFGLGAPIMLVGSVLGGICVIPEPEFEHPRKPFSAVTSLFAGLSLGFVALGLFFVSTDMQNAELASRLKQVGFGLLICASLAVVYHFRDILSQRTLLIATIVTILAYSGNTIPSNMNLYSETALGDLPEKFAGQQNALRFSFKVVAGLLLGYLLTRTNPRAGIVTTASIFVAAQIWAILATGTAYLVAFGIFGAGELVGVYAPNYMLSASPQHDYRRVMAFVQMLMVPAAPTGYVFGAIVDSLTETRGAAFAFRTSFAVCALLITSGIILALAALPKRPNIAAAAAEAPRQD